MDDCGGNDCGRCDVCIAELNEFEPAIMVLADKGMISREERQRAMRELRHRQRR